MKNGNVEAVVRDETVMGRELEKGLNLGKYPHSLGSFETEEATKETREETYGSVTKTKSNSGVIAKERIRTCVGTSQNLVHGIFFFWVGGVERGGVSSRELFRGQNAWR